MPQLTGPRQIMVEHPLWQRLRAYQQGTVMNGGVDAGQSTQTTLGPSGTYTGNESGQWLNVTAPVTPNTEFSCASRPGENTESLPVYFKRGGCGLSASEHGNAVDEDNGLFQMHDR